MCLIYRRLNGTSAPNVLPPELVPPRSGHSPRRAAIPLPVERPVDYVPTRKDAMVYKHADDGGMCARERSLPVRTSRAFEHNAAEGAGQMREDEELECKMEDLHYRVKRIQEDIARGRRSTAKDEEHRELECDLPHFMDERIPDVQKKHEECERGRKREKRTGATSALANTVTYGTITIAIATMAMTETETKTATAMKTGTRGAHMIVTDGARDYDRGLDYGRDREYGRDRPRGPPTATAARLPPPPPPPAPTSMITISVLAFPAPNVKSSSSGERAVYVRKQAQRWLQQRLRVLGVVTPDPSDGGKGPRALDTTVEDRLAREKKEDVARVLQAEKDTEERERARSKRLKEETASDELFAANTVEACLPRAPSYGDPRDVGEPVSGSGAAQIFSSNPPAQSDARLSDSRELLPKDIILYDYPVVIAPDVVSLAVLRVSSHGRVLRKRAPSVQESRGQRQRLHGRVYVPNARFSDAMINYQQTSYGASNSQSFYRRVRVTKKYLGYRRKSGIKAFGSHSARKTVFHCDELGKMFSVEQYVLRARKSGNGKVRNNAAVHDGHEDSRDSSVPAPRGVVPRFLAMCWTCGMQVEDALPPLLFVWLPQATHTTPLRTAAINAIENEIEILPGRPNIIVFELGHMYLQLVQTLNLRLPLIDPSHYISPFAALLEFGDKMPKVAADAVHIVMSPPPRRHLQRLSPLRPHEQLPPLPAGDRPGRQDQRIDAQEVPGRAQEDPSGALTLADLCTVRLEDEMDPPVFTKGKEHGMKEREKESEADDKEDEGDDELLDEIEETLSARLLLNEGILAGTSDTLPLFFPDPSLQLVTHRHPPPTNEPQVETRAPSWSPSPLDATVDAALSEEMTDYLQNDHGNALAVALDAAEQRLARFAGDDALLDLDEVELDTFMLTEDGAKMKDRVCVESNEDYFEISGW
ncbi:hypothetical protein DFH11DRAFT_1818385 [Phellopilus nigrolimitatus]|nr:hypothetical protein DFH11DRAFT_1818385 [Phellopilus nigrolimitatus]